jgi:hypothetical protein
VSVTERLVDGLVEVTIVDLIGPEARKSGGNLGKLVAEVDTLLVGTLGGGRQGSELGVDLVQELGQLAVVESAGVVLVVLFEEEVQAAEMVTGLREAFLHSVGNFCPFGEGEVDLLGIATLFPGDGAEEPDNVVCDVVLDRRAVTNGVDVT